MFTGAIHSILWVRFLFFVVSVLFQFSIELQWYLQLITAFSSNLAILSSSSLLNLFCLSSSSGSYTFSTWIWKVIHSQHWIPFRHPYLNLRNYLAVEVGCLPLKILFQTQFITTIILSIGLEEVASVVEMSNIAGILILLEFKTLVLSVCYWIMD